MLRSGLLLILALSALAARAEPLSSAETAAFLARLEQSRGENPSARADFVEEKRTRLLREPIVSKGTIYFQAPDKFRREVAGSSPSLTVSNGRQLWIYYPNFKEAELYPLGQRAMFDDSIGALTAGLNFADIEKFYNVSVFRDGDAHRIQLIPRRGGLKRMLQELNVWLGDDLLLRRTDLVMAKGDRTVTTFSNQKRAPLPDSTFEFTPPAGANVTRPLGK